MPGSQPQWLDDAEMAAWIPLIQLMVLLPSALDRQLRADSGLTHTHYSVLALLAASDPQPLSMSTIAKITGTEPSRLSHAVRVLEERRFVSRRRSPENRRVQLAVLLPAGRAALADAAPGHVALVRRVVFDRLTSTDLRDLRRIAQKLVAGLEEAPLPTQTKP